MTKYLFILLIAYLPIVSCGQIKVKESKDLIIDTNIKSEVEKHIESSKEFNVLNDKMQVYNNSVIGDFYENNKIVFTSNNKAIKRVFKSFYYWKGDTLKIDGAFGLFTGFGFTLKLYKNKATLYHLLSSDESPAYAYKEKDSLTFRLEVLCTNTKIVISEIPDSSKKQVIYGYVEFHSGDYYAIEGSSNGREELPRKKVRANMKIYFKSSKLGL